MNSLAFDKILDMNKFLYMIEVFLTYLLIQINYFLI